MNPGAVPGSGLLARLRQETRAAHAALEAAVPLMSESVSRADYVRFMTLVGAFHATVEQQLSGVDGLVDVIADLSERRKTERLESDFSALGLQPAALWAARQSLRCPLDPERHAFVPSVSSIDRAVGVLYVLEGSTLGSQLLYRHLSVALPEVMARSSSFLCCYGTRTGQMWNAFREQLETAAPQLDHDAVIDAARDAFVVLRDWFRQSADVEYPDEHASDGPAAKEGSLDESRPSAAVSTASVSTASVSKRVA